MAESGIKTEKMSHYHDALLQKELDHIKGAANITANNIKTFETARHE